MGVADRTRFRRAAAGMRRHPEPGAGASDDRALMSRADSIEEIGLPDAEIRASIITEALDQLTTIWPRVGDLKGQTDGVVFFA